MKTFRFNQEQLDKIGRVMKKGCKYLFYTAVTVLSCSTVTDEIFRSIRYSDGASYSDAVLAIMESDMSSCYRDEAVAVLPKDCEAEIYKAVIHIVSSDMSSCYIVDAIKKLCAKD